jgi:hypothetical protein
MPEQSALDLFLRDRRAWVGVAIIAASFLPLFGAGTSTTSLINVQSQVNAASQVMATMGALAGPAGMGSAGQMTGSLNLLLVLYLVPLTAAAVVLMALIARGTRVWGIASGAAAVILPIAVPLVAGSLFMSALPEQLQAIIAQSGGGSGFTSLNIGVWVLALLGAVQLFFSFQRG